MKNIQRMPDKKFSWKINAPALLMNLDKIMSGLPRPSDNYQGVTGFPVLFLKGENSGYLADGDRSDILKVFPAAEIQIISNAGHWIHSDNPEAVIKSHPQYGGRSSMAECLTVDQDVVGSTPISHPLYTEKVL